MRLPCWENLQIKETRLVIGLSLFLQIRLNNVKYGNILENYLFRRHGAIGLETMFEAIELPTGVAHLDSGLTDMDGKAFSHFELVWGFSIWIKR